MDAGSSGVPLSELWRVRAPHEFLKGAAILGHPVAGDHKHLPRDLEVVAAMLSAGSSVPDGLAMVLFPQGLATTSEAPPPSVLATVLDSFTFRAYVAAVVRYVKLKPSDELFSPLVTCVWSHLPDIILQSFLELLVTLHEGVLDAPDESYAISALRLTRALAWLVFEVPGPPPGTSLFLYGLHSSSVHGLPFWRTRSCQSHGGLPAVHVQLRHVLTALAACNILLIVRLLLLEHKVLFISSSTFLLTAACEAFARILLFPLSWGHVYSPMIPSSEYLDLPPPWLYGSDRSIVQMLLKNGSTSAGQDFSVFDLDTGDTALAEDFKNLPALPEAAESKLRFGLVKLRARSETLCDFEEEHMAEHASSDFDFDAQDLFFHFTGSLLGGVRDFIGGGCHAATTHSASVSFQHASFLSSVDLKDQPFYSAFIRTQAFTIYLQSLHLYSVGLSPFEEAVRTWPSRSCLTRCNTPDSLSASCQDLEWDDSVFDLFGSFVGRSHEVPDSRDCDTEVASLCFVGASVVGRGLGTATGLEGGAMRQRPNTFELHLLFRDEHGVPSDVFGETVAGSRHLADDYVITEVLQQHANGTQNIVASEQHKGACIWDQQSFLVEAMMRESDRHLSRKGGSLWAARLYEAARSKFQNGLWSTDVASTLLCACLTEHAGISCSEGLLRLYMNAGSRVAQLPLHRLWDVLLELPSERIIRILSEDVMQLNASAGLVQKLFILSLQARSAAPFALVEAAGRNREAPAHGDTSHGSPVARAGTPQRGTDVKWDVCQIDVTGGDLWKVELLPFDGPDTSVLNRKRFCIRTTRPPALIVEELLVATWRATLAGLTLENVGGLMAELQCCQLEGLRHDERLCFWLNCFNVGALLAVMSDSLQVGRLDTVASWLAFFRTMKLEIYGHLFSLLDIEFLVLRAQTSAPQYQRTRGPGQSQHIDLLASLPPKSENDKRKHLCLARSAREVSFGLCYPIKDGMPPLRVFYPELVSAQLVLNCGHFLLRGLRVDAKRGRVAVPGLLRCYLSDFGGSDASVLEYVCGILRAFLGKVVELEHAQSSGSRVAVSPRDRLAIPEVQALLTSLESVVDGGSNRSGSRAPDALTVEYVDLDWAFLLPDASLCPLLLTVASAT